MDRPASQFWTALRRSVEFDMNCRLDTFSVEAVKPAVLIIPLDPNRIPFGFMRINFPFEFSEP